MTDKFAGPGVAAHDWRSRLVRALAQPLPAHHKPPGDTDTRRRKQAATRRAGVLIPIVAGDQPRIVFTQRSNELRSHPGQISFPGGSLECADSGTEAAALREAHEEIGLAPEAVEIVGPLPRYRTGTGFDIDPYVGWVDPHASVAPDQVEVVRIFSVPLVYALDHRHFSRHEPEYDGRRLLVYAIDYEDNHIWGATAGILYGLLEKLAFAEQNEDAIS